MFKLLIADDEEIIRKRLVMKIEWNSLGFEVIGEASNGLELLELIKRLKPDVVLTDIRMPLMDGIELVEKVKEENIDTEIIVLSGFAEFEYAQKMLRLGVKDYILKPIDKEQIYKVFEALKYKLNEKNNKFRDLKSKFIIDIFMNNLSDVQIEEKNYEFYHSDKLFSIVNLQIDEFTLHQEEITNKDILKNIFTSEFNCILVSESKDDIFYFVEVDNSERYINILESTFEKVNQFLQELGLHYSVSFFYDFPNDDLKEINKIRNKIFKTKKERAYLGPKVFKKASEEKKLVNNQFIYPFEIEENIIKSFNAQDLITLQTNVAMFFSKFKEQDVEFAVVSNMSFQLLNHIYRYLRENNKTNGRIRDIFKQIFSDFNKYEFFETLEGFIKYLLKCTLIETKNISEGFLNLYMEKAIKFIDLRYSEDIGLDEVAEHVGLSSAYMSHIFKKELNISFVQYLKDKRLKEAIRLLKDTNLKVYEVAEKIGFNNTRYFSDVFRAEIGVNPLEYRNKFRSQNK